MIHGMTCRVKIVSFGAFALQLLTFIASGPSARGAKVCTGPSFGDKSTPQLNVRVYSFAGLSPELLSHAESEAVRVLQGVPVELNWIDCASQALSAVCMSEILPTDLVVRVIRKALPKASEKALGISGPNGGQATAFLFYDRMFALRTHARPLRAIVGRVLAHEISHLLRPDEGHSEVGLMRGQWTADDMRLVSSGYMGLPAASVRLMQREALRRVTAARELAVK